MDLACIAGFEDRRRETQAKKRLLEDGQSKETDSTLEPLERMGIPVNTLILAQWDPFQTFDFHNYKIVKFVSF